MRINTDKILKNLLEQSNGNKLKWNYYKNNSTYVTFNSYDYITEKKKIQFEVCDYVNNVKMSSIAIYYVIKGSRNLIYTINYRLSPNLMVDLINVLNYKLEKKEIQINML